jgi:hypothetical protein
VYSVLLPQVLIGLVLIETSYFNHIVKKLLSVFSLINKNGTYHVKVIQIKLLGK